jgi:DNA invertase Pin-like site-specific DNA recombinase
MNFGQIKYSVGCYCRLSRDDGSSGESASIETQKKMLADYCQANGFSVYDFYCDDGYTGTNFNRPNFIRMMEDVESGAVNLILVKDLSRLGRNHIETGRYIEEIFPQKGVRFIAVSDGVDSEMENMYSDIMTPMRNVMNEYYPADISRKTRLAFKTKAEHGEFIGTYAPYGYRKSAEDKHVLEPDEQTAPLIVEMFEMVAYKGFGYNKIAKVFREGKILTPSAYRAKLAGKPYHKDPYDWNMLTVRKMLENQAYL